MLDNESCWLKNRTAEENIAEFKAAMLEHIDQADTFEGDGKDVVLLETYRKYAEEFVKGLRPFLEIQEKADYYKLTHLLQAYAGYKAPDAKLERVK